MKRPRACGLGRQPCMPQMSSVLETFETPLNEMLQSMQTNSIIQSNPPQMMWHRAPPPIKACSPSPPAPPLPDSGPRSMLQRKLQQARSAWLSSLYGRLRSLGGRGSKWCRMLCECGVGGRGGRAEGRLVACHVQMPCLGWRARQQGFADASGHIDWLAG